MADIFTSLVAIGQTMSHVNGPASAPFADAVNPCVLDANSAVLWRLDEGTATPPTDIGFLGVTMVASSNAPSVAGKFGSARSFSGNPQGYKSATTLDPTLFNADLTVEALVNVSSAPASAGTIAVYGSSNSFESLESENALFYLLHHSDGKLRFGWQYGVQQSVNVYSASTIPLNQWVHVMAVRRVWNTGQCGVRMYLNGVLDSETAGLPIPTGGTNSNMRLGLGTNPPFDAAGWFVGSIDDVRISPVARTPTAKKVDRVAGSTPQVKRTFSANRRAAYGGRVFSGHILDANTLALWRMDNNGGSSEPDISGNGYDLTSLHDSTSIPGVISYGRSLTGNSGTGLWSAAAPSAITPLHGEYTIEALVRTNVSTGGPLVVFRVPGGISYPAQDPLLDFDIGPTNLNMVLYYSSGPLYNSCPSPFGVISVGVWTHVAGRKRLNGAGPNYDMHLFVNGVQVAQTLNVPGPAVGDGNDTSGAWTIGSTYPGTGPFAVYTNVDVDDIRVSKVARTNGEILTSYQNALIGS